jgi:selenide,water dikinase
VPGTSTRLTLLAQGSGCGCKLSPILLEQLLRGAPSRLVLPELLVDSGTNDDATVYRITNDLAIVATADFLTPIVDDPFDFGQIAATNALSDVYAMGGSPKFALALLGLPLDRVPINVGQRILAGGVTACERAGVPITGGHSIESPEPFYGLSVTGTVHPDRILRNSIAKDGDALVLTKGLGMGTFGSAERSGKLVPEAYKIMMASGTQLNSVGKLLPYIGGVSAVTDVTGFGLLGHTLEIARASGLLAYLQSTDIPILKFAENLAREGFNTGGALRNWNGYKKYVQQVSPLERWHRSLLCEPETSGGLLIAVSPFALADLLTCLRDGGFHQASVIGHLETGTVGLILA